MYLKHVQRSSEAISFLKETDLDASSHNMHMCTLHESVELNNHSTPKYCTMPV